MKFISEITNLEDTFFRPVVTDLAHQIASDLMLHDRIEIRNKSGASVNSPKTALGRRTSMTLESGRYTLDVTATEEVEMSKVATAGHGRHLTKAIYYDDKADFHINPIYIDTKLTLSVTINTQSRSEAANILSRIRTLVGSGKEQKITSVQYSYLIPIDTLSTIRQIREFLGDTVETMEEWRDRCFTKSLTAIAPPGGVDPLPAIRENQDNVIAQYQYMSVTGLEDRQEDGRGSLSFEYIVYLQRPQALSLNYPMIIQGKPIPKALRVDMGVIENSGVTNTNSTFDSLRNVYRGSQGAFDMIRYPEEDDWSPKHYPSGYVPILSCLIAVDPNNPRSLFSMSDLEGIITFGGDTLEYIRDFRADVPVAGLSLFYIALYRDEYIVREGVSLSETLELRANASMRDGHTYRLVFHVHLTPNMLPLDKRYRPMFYPDMVQRYLYGMNITVEPWPERLDKVTIDAWWEHLNKRYLTYPSDRIGVYCPSVFNIHAMRN